MKQRIGLAALCLLVMVITSGCVTQSQNPLAIHATTATINAIVAKRLLRSRLGILLAISLCSIPLIHFPKTSVFIFIALMLPYQVVVVVPVLSD